MNTPKRVVAAVQLLLIFPAVLFMGSLVERNLQPLQNEPAHTAQRIVMWYAVRQWTLWVLLIALPFVVLVTGCITFLRSRGHNPELPQGVQHALAAIRADRAMPFIAAMTLTAAVVLTIVATHMLAN